MFYVKKIFKNCVYIWRYLLNYIATILQYYLNQRHFETHKLKLLFHRVY